MLVRTVLSHVYKKVNSHRGLKSKMPLEKMHRIVIKDYLKPVVKMRYGIGQLCNGSKRLVNADLHYTGRQFILQHHVEIVSGPLFIDYRWTESL